MGRDITGVRGELNKPPYAKVRAKVSSDTEREVNPNLPEENQEVKDCEVKECTSEAPRAENSLEKQEMLAVESTNFETEKLGMKSAKAKDQKSSFPEKPSSDVTIDKQVCGSPIEVETAVSPTGNNSKTPSSTKKTQPSTPHVTRKQLDDEDNWSMTSSASVRTTRSRTTVPVAPTFTISDRLEKRKEYYAKLEEKRKALEAEKREYDARTKEEEEAAIKQLRKNMKFKANPVPSFYYDKSAPKKELKKLPTTRAISPKFGRRKSFGDALRSPSEEKPSVRTFRHSLSGPLLKEGLTPTSTPKKKDRLTQVREMTRQTPPKINEQTISDVAVQS